MSQFQVLVRAAGAPNILALNVESSETAAEVVEKYACATGERVHNNNRNVSLPFALRINLGIYFNLTIKLI
jgi:hypothetical protein